MSRSDRCPDWRRLAAWRDSDEPAPASWSDAVEHLAGCRICRQRLAAWDPTLLLAATPPPPVEDVEVAEMVSAVRALRRAETLGLRPADRRPRRAALVAGVALAGLLAASAALRWIDAPEPLAAPAPPVLVSAELEPVPLIEELQPSRARIYQFGADDLPVVLIFDETLDF